MVFGLDAPTKQQVMNVVPMIGGELSKEEMDRRLWRLTEAEKLEFVRLLEKMEGRGAHAEESEPEPETSPNGSGVPPQTELKS
jgi:hypothetical protein